jgi:hypothetical protein
MKEFGAQFYIETSAKTNQNIEQVWKYYSVAFLKSSKCNVQEIHVQ